jgi:hypothetical protein
MKSKLLAHLVRLREARLKEQAAELKVLAGRLDAVRRQHDDARSSAALSIASAENLGDLGVMGQSRIRCAKLAVTAAAEIQVLSEKLGHCRKLADVAHEAAVKVERSAAAERDLAMENEAEQFLAWNKVSGR